MKENGDSQEFDFEDSPQSSDDNPIMGTRLSEFFMREKVVLGVILVMFVWTGAGALFATGYFEEPPPPQQPAEIEFLVDQSPEYVYESISMGPVPSNENLIEIANKSNIQRENGTETSRRVQVTARVQVRERNSRIFFDGNRIYVGKSVTLDLGNVVIDATITDMNISGTTNTG